ncbi:MAG TPA: nicotinate-nucleotide adenylyltransferase [Ktedonobacterales bacterium]|nr:nicotinate-nucleotide adenylyltransferase [Ktedonobacterales bacterium]
MDEHARADTQESRVRAGPRYGILGGTFDPPHLGHLVLAQEVHARLGLDRVWFLPAGVPPHKTGRAVSPAADRREMVQRAIAGDERFALSAVELTRPGPSYTADTLEQLREQWGRHAMLHLILGWDMLMYLPNWHAPERVLAATDVVVAAHRPDGLGAPSARDDLARLTQRIPAVTGKVVVLPAPQLDISASALRERVASDLPIRYLVPDAVREYIDQHGLYRA